MITFSLIIQRDTVVISWCIEPKTVQSDDTVRGNYVIFRVQVIITSFEDDITGIVCTQKGAVPFCLITVYGLIH